MLLSNVFLFSDQFECLKAWTNIMCNNCSLHEEQAINWSKLTFLALLPPSPYLIPSPDSILPIPCLTFPIKNPTDRKLEYHDRRLYPNTYYIFKSCKEITFILTMQQRRQIAQEYFPSLSISDHFTLDIRFHQFSKTNLTQACLRYMSDRKRPLSKFRFYPQ